MTDKKKREQDGETVNAEPKVEWSEKRDQPSQAAGFEGATPQASARASLKSFGKQLSNSEQPSYPSRDRSVV